MIEHSDLRGQKRSGMHIAHWGTVVQNPKVQIAFCDSAPAIRTVQAADRAGIAGLWHTPAVLFAHLRPFYPPPLVRADDKH